MGKTTASPRIESTIPPENRPTKERLRHGSDIVGTAAAPTLKHALRPTEFAEKGAGRQKGAVYRDTASTPVLRAYRDGKLTQRQKEAADYLEWLHDAVKESGGQRDSLDMAPRGQRHESDAVIARLIDAKAAMAKIRAMFDVPAWHALTTVVVDHRPVVDWRETYRRARYVKRGLSQVADFRGLPQDEAASAGT